ncbi:MAG: NUDIX domain-containing protein [Candidatus Liptonbacteria bacterium]|nr:NUDIX domain-containing protein [Candidatus Liptonbacteria bacterium]
MEIPQFGTKQEGIPYVDRPSAYALIMRADGRIPVIEDEGKYFLLGGGLEAGESEEEALRREIFEEAGREMLSFSFLGKANQYVDAPEGHFNKLGVFYRVEMRDEKKMEHDPSFQWITIEEFRAHAAHEAQVWAIENLLRR